MERINFEKMYINDEMKLDEALAACSKMYHEAAPGTDDFDYYYAMTHNLYHYAAVQYMISRGYTAKGLEFVRLY